MENRLVEYSVDNESRNHKYFQQALATFTLTKTVNNAAHKVTYKVYF